MVFSYTEDTEVTGAQQGVAGLATKAGSPVVVHYTSSGDSKIAKKIEVQDRTLSTPADRETKSVQ